MKRERVVRKKAVAEYLRLFWMLHFSKAFRIRSCFLCVVHAASTGASLFFAAVPVVASFRSQSKGGHGVTFSAKGQLSILQSEPNSLSSEHAPESPDLDDERECRDKFINKKNMTNLKM